jgi:7-cyano-7-deazaguanine tRNA-ribosyltransferase
LGLSFEVRGTDLLGRVGRLRVGTRSVETPYMFPVVHPVKQVVGPEKMRDLGFKGLMTNSYITRGRRNEEALKAGIHSILGFDGLVMTDSGGYQALEYGDLDVTYGDMGSFQSMIGADLAVTLDRPTGYPQTRAVARETMEYSLKNAVATLNEFEGGTVWVGPIQGGLYPDLVRRSASSMVEAGFDVLALGSPVQIMQNYMFADLVKMIVAARGAIPYSVPLHLFGAGHPFTMALAAALGCDTFDSASYALFARTGRYMSLDGIMDIRTMEYLPCSCETCAKSTARGLAELGKEERERALAIHNLHVLRQELEACKEAISEGRLWDLVESRSMAHPKLREAFLELAKNSKMLTAGTPAMKEKGLLVRSQSDFVRPEVLIASERLQRAFTKSTTKAVVSGSALAHGGAKGKRADVFKVHPVLGAFPAEVEFLYPFAQTVVAEPFSEADLGKAKETLRRRGYRTVVVPRKPRNRRSPRGASPSPRYSSAPPR